MTNKDTKIAIIGGTGALGSGLAKSWARKGFTIIIGSRSKDKAVSAASDLSDEIASEHITGDDQPGAAEQGDIVVITIPYANHADTLTAIKPYLKGKIVIDATVPLKPPKVARVQLPEAGCAAVETQKILGEEVRVVSALQNIGAQHLHADHTINCDVLVCGDEPDARQNVIELLEAIGLKAWHAGPLDNSAAAEALTSVLIHINKRYKIAGAGIRISNGE
jgi:NADPH-dependent F420 reductase